MSQYYNPRRTKYLYNPKASEPFRVSRSKIDLFVQCPLCLYLDIRLGVGRPPSFPLTLNNAVDQLMKKEFDAHRANKTPHPIMEKYGIKAVPLAHEKMEEWRDAFKRGISFYHEPTNLIVRGGVDDVWVNEQGEYFIVDYKATSKDELVTLDDEWKIQYKRQMEIYQWLFRKNGFNVSKTGYFVYVNGRTDKDALDGKLEFDVTVIPYAGDDSWVEDTITSMYKSVSSSELPKPGDNCDYCNYRRAARDVLMELRPKTQEKQKPETLSLW